MIVTDPTVHVHTGWICWWCCSSNRSSPVNAPYCSALRSWIPSRFSITTGIRLRPWSPDSSTSLSTMERKWYVKTALKKVFIADRVDGSYNLHVWVPGRLKQLARKEVNSFQHFEFAVQILRHLYTFIKIHKTLHVHLQWKMSEGQTTAMRDHPPWKMYHRHYFWQNNQ